MKRMLCFESTKRISASQMLSHPYFTDVRIESAKEKKEKSMSINTDLERRKREKSMEHFEDYYQQFLKKPSIGPPEQNSNQKKESPKVKTTEFLLQGGNELTPMKRRNPKDLDQLLEEFEPDFNLINSQKSQKYIDRLSNQKLPNSKNE